jgi:hypothetical protein
MLPVGTILIINKTQSECNGTEVGTTSQYSSLLHTMLATPSLHPNLTVMKSKAFETLFTKIRDKETSSSEFVHYSK